MWIPPAASGGYAVDAVRVPRENVTLIPILMGHCVSGDGLY